MDPGAIRRACSYLTGLSLLIGLGTASTVHALSTWQKLNISSACLDTDQTPYAKTLTWGQAYNANGSVATGLVPVDDSVLQPGAALITMHGSTEFFFTIR